MPTTSEVANLCGVLPDENTVVFIDGVHIFNCAKIIGLDINYSKLRTLYQNSTNLIRMHYYNNAPSDPDITFSLQKLFDWLSYNGFATSIQYVECDSDMRFNSRADLFPQMVADIFSYLLLAKGKIDRIVIFSANYGFVPVLSLIKSQGIKVSMIGQLTRFPDEIRRECDEFRLLEGMRELVQKDFEDAGSSRQRLVEA